MAVKLEFTMSSPEIPVSDENSTLYHYGVCQLNVGSKEDRYSINLSHLNDGHTKSQPYASFAVFDGHNGSNSAQFCADQLHLMIVDIFNGLYETFYKQFCAKLNVETIELSDALTLEHYGLTLGDINDALMSEACKSSCEFVDVYLQRTTNSGTTMSSVFLKHNPETKMTQLYCCNVGDSRTVLAVAVDIDAEKNHDNTTMNTESNKADETMEPELVDRYANTTIRRSAQLIEICQDHTLKLRSERERIEKHAEVITPSLPYYNKIPNDFEDLSNCMINDDEIIKKLPNATNLVKSVVDAFIASDSEKGNFFKKVEREELQLQDVAVNDGSIEPQGIRLVHDESFIAHRRTYTGDYGTEAVFGRYNVSLMMTRTIGDRLGPRCCRGTPDIFSVQLPKSRHCRIVLGSDGLWDVLTSDFVRINAMSPKYYQPEVFAEFLAKKALKRRQRLNLRMDDITVVVVDCHVTPETFRPIPNAEGVDYLVNGVSSTQQSACTFDCCII